MGKWSFETALGNFRAMTSNGDVVGDYVRELDVDSSLTWSTVVDFLVSLRSLVFPQWLPSLLVSYSFLSTAIHGVSLPTAWHSAPRCEQ